MQSHGSLDFQNGSLVSGGGVRSDGSIKLEDTQVPCHIPTGPIQYGYGLSYANGIIRTNNAGLCGITPTAETSTISFPSVTVPGSNDDAAICVPVEQLLGLVHLERADRQPHAAEQQRHGHPDRQHVRVLQPDDEQRDAEDQAGQRQGGGDLLPGSRRRRLRAEHLRRRPS